MPTTNRPFFANFFAAFRAHTALQKTSPAINTSNSPSTAASAAAYSNLARTYHTTSSPESSSIQIPLKTAHSSQATHSTSPHSAVATAPPQSHFRTSRPLHPPNGTPQSCGRIRSASREPVYGPHPQPQPQTTESITPPFNSRNPSPGGSGMPTPTYGLPRGRRGSDSSSHSSGSAKPVLGASPPPSSMADKWYIGGRTAQGEERFYKLGLVSTTKSADRLSLDRLSL